MKPLWRSLTVRGGALAIIGALLSLFGVEVAPEDLQAIADAGFAIVTAIGGIMAIAGKIRSNNMLKAEQDANTQIGGVQ